MAAVKIPIREGDHPEEGIEARWRLKLQLGFPLFPYPISSPVSASPGLCESPGGTLAHRRLKPPRVGEAVDKPFPKFCCRALWAGSGNYQPGGREVGKKNSGGQEFRSHAGLPFPAKDDAGCCRNIRLGLHRLPASAPEGFPPSPGLIPVGHSAGAISVGTSLEVCLEDRLKNEFERSLDHPIFNRRFPQSRTFTHKSGRPFAGHAIFLCLTPKAHFFPLILLPDSF